MSRCYICDSYIPKPSIVRGRTEPCFTCLQEIEDSLSEFDREEDEVIIEVYDDETFWENINSD